MISITPLDPPERSDNSNPVPLGPDLDRTWSGRRVGPKPALSLARAGSPASDSERFRSGFLVGVIVEVTRATSIVNLVTKVRNSPGVVQEHRGGLPGQQVPSVAEPARLAASTTRRS